MLFDSSIVSGCWSVLAWLNLGDLPQGRKSSLRSILPSRKDQIERTWNWQSFLAIVKRSVFTFVFLALKSKQLGIVSKYLESFFIVESYSIDKRAMLMCVYWVFFPPPELGSYPGLNASSSYLYFPRLTVQPVNFPFYATTKSLCMEFSAGQFST